MAVFLTAGSTTSSTTLQNEGELGDDDVFTVSSPRSDPPPARALVPAPDSSCVNHRGDSLNRVSRRQRMLASSRALSLPAFKPPPPRPPRRRREHRGGVWFCRARPTPRRRQLDLWSCVGSGRQMLMMTVFPQFWVSLVQSVTSGSASVGKMFLF